MPRPKLRDKIIDTASELFYKGGIRATGIDLIIAQSGIARMTLYNNFPSKDALVSAVLERECASTRSYLESIVAQSDKSPEERLGLLFAALEAAMQAPDFYGCLFIKAAAEYPDESHTFHQAALGYKALYRDSLRQLVSEMKVADAETLTAQLFLLFEGALVTAQVDPSCRSVREALSAAHILVQHHRQS